MRGILMVRSRSRACDSALEAAHIWPGAARIAAQGRGMCACTHAHALHTPGLRGTAILGLR